MSHILQIILALMVYSLHLSCATTGDLTLIAEHSKAACANGPYLFDNSCKLKSQGIGSSINRSKHTIVLSQAYNISIIPNPACFRSDTHGTDMLDYLGWALSVDCSAEDVSKARVVRNDDTILDKGLLQIEVTNFDQKSQRSDEKTPDNIQIDKVCRAIYNNQDFAKLAKGFTSNDAIASNALFPRMNYLMSKFGTAKNIVFNIGNRYIVEGFMCARHFIRNQWLARKEREGRRVSSYDFNRVNIAFHLRHGDVATKNVNFIDQRDVVRTIPLDQGIKVLQGILGPGSVLYNADVTINFYSEGNLEEFADLRKAFPLTRFFLGNASTLTKDIDEMATSDVLIASPSSFTALVASLNLDGVILVDRENPEKFEGIDNAIPQATILKKNFKGFNEMFCRQKLFTTLRNKLCGFELESNLAASHKKAHKSEHRHDFGRIDDIYAEINRLRKKLEGVNQDSHLDIFRNELQMSSVLNKHFADHAHNIGCHRTGSTNVLDESLKTICDEGVHSIKHMSSADSKDKVAHHLHWSYFLRAAATKIVEDGFQIPVYVVQGPSKERYLRLQENLKLSGIQDQHVTWRSDFLANNISAEDRTFFRYGRLAYWDCAEVLQREKPCRKGYPFSNVEMSVALKHVAIIRSIADTARKNLPESAKNVSRRYNLVIEDDQFLPKQLLRQIVETLLQIPDHVGTIMLDDSFFLNSWFNPPEDLLKYPFPVTYEKNATRTAGAYLISDDTAITLVDGKNLFPMAAPIDEQLKFALRKHNIATHWIFPPMTCAGSQGLEDGAGSTTGGKLKVDKYDRVGCRTCCNRFYNVSNMEEFYAMGVKRGHNRPV